jgi:NAD(P)-dependent dehydrogenase (short-subunit alcohol dehydrogenase family)
MQRGGDKITKKKWWADHVAGRWLVLSVRLVVIVGGRVELRDRVVVVTGGTAGVGRATVQAFATRGARLGVIARGQARLDETVMELRAHGGTAVGVSADVADYEQLAAAAEVIEAELGPIDVWVNNAMVSVFAPFVEIAPAEFRRVTDVTYHGYVHGTHVALALMLPRGHGTIIQVGSALTERSIPIQSAYCGAKHAIVGFTASVRCELLHLKTHVRIAVVQLPGLNTPHFDWALSRLPRRAQPVAPIFQPEIPARAIVAIAEKPRRELWVGWSTIRAMAANRVIPGLLDRYLARKGIGAQQSDEPEDPDRPTNLWEPVGAQVGAHGRFDRDAIGRSPALWLALHKRAVLTTTALGLAFIAILILIV